MFEIEPGQFFDTPFEKGCEAITSPDEYGGFSAYDSDRVICLFNVVMIEAVYVKLRKSNV
jgi:hypothetical protein